ncbi:carboxypeptidase regulatory-like domain-containing protein, partial [Acidobacteriota bacterium]
MMISKTIKQTKARINEIMSKALLFLIISIPCFYVSFSPIHGQETDVMASGELIVKGVRLEITPAQQTVPINTETVVNTVFSVDNPELVEGMMVKGTLRGPGIKDSITLTTLPNHPFSIPGFTSKGTYTLENIQLEKNGKKLVTAEPDQAVIEAMDIIITKVESRPLTLEEIREKGIVISDENFSVYNFSVGFIVNSQEVKYEFPIVYSGNNEVYIPTPQGGSGFGLPGGPRGREPIPIRFELPDLNLPENEEGERETGRPVSGVVIINNDIAFLNQFFSVMFIVSNQAPEGSSLALKDLTAKITFPDGLREAETNPPHLMGAPVPVRCPGPDGKIGTADDLEIILATFSGMAEFLAEGLKEGTHIVDIDFEGTLSGLPSGDTPFTGSAAGAVIVRNPEFGITFAHPSVIRKGEEYDIYVTMTNTSPVVANLVSLTMPATRLVGTSLLSDETVSWETIEPKESVTAQFHMRSNETGRIRASAFEADGSVSGKFVLTAGVGEKGIPLSPDTLVLPEWAYSLPDELINASLILLGEAYSIATTPPGGLPEGLPYVNSALVKERAKEFAEAGQRYTYGDSLINTVSVLTLDWLGSRLQDINFDILRRLTSKGLKFAQQQAIIFNDALNSQSAVDFQRSFAETCSYKPPFVSALLSFGGGSRSAYLRITDFYQNRLSNEQGILDLIRNIPYGELYVMEDAGQNPVDFALIGHPDENGYTMEILGEADGTFDLSLIVPDTTGGFRQVVFPGVSSQIGSVASITLTSTDTNFTLSIDNNGDGQEDSQVAGIVTPVQAPPLQLIGAVQECSADSAGHATALFFNRSLDPETAKDKTNYYVTDKSIYASFLQPSGRVVLIGTNNPISPFVESLVRAANLKDTSGGLLTPSPVEMPIISTIKTPGGIVFGKVLSALGEPIANAKIQLEERNGSKRTLSFDISDSTGSYQFDFVRIFPDPFIIKVQDVTTGKIETVSSRLMSNGQRLQIDIIMRGRGSVQGRVLNTNGIPLANAAVSARAENTGIWESYGTATNENGEYTINDIPIGHVTLSAGKSGQYGNASTTITAPDQIQTVDITVVSAKSADVSGRVFYNDGVTPAAEAYVNFYGEHQYGSSTKTDDQGYFQFSSVPIGTFSIRAYNPLTGKQGGYVTGELVENQDYNATIIFRGTGRIHGKVSSYDGVPQTGVFVYLSNTAFYMDTDSNGNFDFQEVPVGDYNVIAAHRTVNLKASSPVELITEGQEAYVSLAFPNTMKGSITGTVYDVDGTTRMPDTDVFVCDGNNIARGVATSNQNGVFTIENLAVGYYTVFIARPGLAGVARTTVQFPGHQAVCDVQYLGKGKVNINVFGPDGQTRVIANVIFRRTVFEMEEGSFIGFHVIEEKYTSNENGPLEIDEVFMGSFYVSAKNEFYPRGASYSGNITSPGQEVNVNLVMKPSGKVKVTVVNWKGQTPISDAALEFRSGRLIYKEGIYTDENGVFEFTLVPPGNFQITADDSKSGLKGICYGTMGQTGDLVEVTLRLLGKGQVNGVVKNQSGGLIPNAKVTLKNIGFPHETFKANTDANGQFTIYGVWEGKFSVSAFFSDLQIGGRTEGEITQHDAQANVEVILEAIGTVKGRVMSPDGVSEMTDTQVVLYHSKFNYKAVGYFYVSQEGGYTFENIPKGQFYLEAIHPASGRKGKRSGSVTTEGQVVEVDVYLEGRGTVTGTFYDGSGANPVPYANIKITSQGTYPFTLQSTTDPEGNFTFGQVAQGEFDLDATDPANGLKGSASGQVEYDGETVYIDVIAQGWGIVKGVIYDAQGTGKVNRAQVKLTQGYKVLTEFSGPDPNNPSDTKKDGEYEFTLVPVGSFTIVAYDSVNNSRDYGTASGKVGFHGQVVTVDITFKGLGSVTGHVFDGSGGIMQGIPVTLTSGNEKFPSVSNSSGMYSFENVRMGPFSLEAKQDLTNLYASGNGELTQNGQTVTIDLILESAGSVMGRVLNPDGTTPAENAYLKLKGTNFTRYFLTGPTGEFEFNAVRLGGFTLEVQGYNQEGKARDSGQVDNDGEIVNVGDLMLDNERPQVSAINFPDGSDVNGSAGIPLSTSLTIHFSEEITAASISSTTIYLNSINGKVNGPLVLQPDGKSVVFTPPLLNSFVLYTLNVTTSLEDIAGNTLETTATASFTTSDIQPPVVVAVNPANDAQGVPVNAVIIVTFNEPVDDSKFSSQNFVVKKGDLTNGEPVNHQPLVFNASKTSVTLIPESPLQPNAGYTVGLSNFYDFSNNLQTAAFTSHFSTIDTLAPTFKSISPPDGTTVTEGGNITVTVTFNETDIAVVHFSVNGQTKYSDTSSPYKYQFTAPLISEVGNSILVEVLAVDNAGNQSTKANLTINLKQDLPPQITLTGPPVSTVLPGGTINCSITASDDLGLSRVVLTALGGNLNYNNTQEILNSDTGFTKIYSIAVPADILPDTHIILHAHAVDIRGNVSNAADIPLKVPQDEQDPLVTITSPNPGDSFQYGQSITIRAQASDDVAIKEVRIYFSDQLKATFTQPPYETVYGPLSKDIDGEVGVR